MVSHKISISSGIISLIRNTLDIKSNKWISHKPQFYLLCQCTVGLYNVNVQTYRTNLKTLCTAQKRSVRALFTTVQQPHSRDIFINQKILHLDKLINQQEDIYLRTRQSMPHKGWTAFSIIEMFGIKSNLKIMATWAYHYMQPHVLTTLCATEPSIRAWNGLSEAYSIGTDTTLVRPCKRTTWWQFYLTRNPLYGLARVARPNRPAAPVPMLHASDDVCSSSSLCTFNNKLWQLYLSLTQFPNTWLVWLWNNCLAALK